MINFNKLQGITDNVATAIKKAQNGMRATMQQKPNAASAKKLTGSLDGLAAQNKATTAAQNKAELVKLGKLRQRLMKSYIRPEHLDNTTLRKIEKEAEKIKGMNFDELKKYGCSPTNMPEISAVDKFIKHPHISPQTEFMYKKTAIEDALRRRGYDVDSLSGKKLAKITKKTQEYEANMLKKAGKQGAASNGDPLDAALKKVVPDFKPQKAEKAADIVNAPEIKVTPRTEKMIDAGEGDLIQPNELENIKDTILKPKYEPKVSLNREYSSSSIATSLPSDYKIGEKTRMVDGLEVVEPIINPKYMY